MRVICIDDVPTKCCNSNRVVGVPKYGDIDTVIEERVFTDYLGIDFGVYILERFGTTIGFDKYHFAPLSNIDETELIKEREHDTCKV